MEALLSKEDILSVGNEFKQLKRAFFQANTEVPSTENAEQASESGEHEDHDDLHVDSSIAHEGEENSGEDTQEEIHFREINEKFEERFSAAKAERDNAFKRHAKERREILSKLHTLIQEEENIGKACNTFNALKEEWKNAGATDNETNLELQAEFHRLAELFYYNINIYKELKEHDLKKNLEEKKKIIAEQAELLKETDVKKLEQAVRINQERWGEIGPTFKEEWDNLKDAFWNSTREIYRVIQEHYEARKELLQANNEKKKEIIESLKQRLAVEVKSAPKWQEATQAVQELQQAWNKAGPVLKESSQDLWKEFKGLCDDFYQRKRAFFDVLKEKHQANKERKEALIEKALAFNERTDWRKATPEIIALQKEWKTIGPASQRDENKLWKKFREACDAYFARKSGAFAADAEQETQNLAAKEAVIAELTAWNPTGRKAEDMAALRDYQNKWRSIGFVPIAEKERIQKAYEDLLDKHYQELKVETAELEKLKFQQRLDGLKGDNRAEFNLRREQDIIRKKIDALQGEINQLENNMGFFAQSKGASKIIQDVERKVNQAREKIDGLKMQLKLIREAAAQEK